jgi:SNF2 family DNA or RNA helicase
LTKKSLIGSTPQEIKKWWPEKKVVKIANQNKVNIREMVAETAVKMDAILMANYEVVRTTPLVANMQWDILVVDEVHKLKGGANSNGPTAIWTAIKDLAHKTKFMFLLSGTPMVNDPIEMWSYLHIFTPEKFPTLKAFRRDFCVQQKVAGEFQLVVDPQKLLKGALKGQMIRRTIQEIGLEMPEFDIEDRFLDMGDEQTRVYEEMRTKFFVWVDEQEGKMISSAAVIAQLNYLRQISVYPGMLHQGEITLQVNDSVKVDETMDLIDDFADQCIVGCTFNAPLFEIQRRCHAKGVTAEVLTGSTSTSSGDFERSFQSGDLRVFLMNTKMGAGMNLHKSPEDWKGGARYGITLDRWWSPADNDQFYRRIWRPGATQAVVMYNLYSRYNEKNTVDAFIENIIAEKTQKIGNIADSPEVRPGREWKVYLETLI